MRSDLSAWRLRLDRAVRKQFQMNKTGPSEHLDADSCRKQSVGVEKGTKAVISANSSPPSTLEFAEKRVIGEMATFRQLRPRALIARRFRGRWLQAVPVGRPIYLALVCVISPGAPPLKCDVGCRQSFADHNQIRNIGIFGVSSDDVVNETGLMVLPERGEFVVDAAKDNWVSALCGHIRHTWWRWHKICLYFFVADSKPNIELLSLIREQCNRRRIRLDLSAQLRLSFKRLPKMLTSLRFRD